MVLLLEVGNPDKASVHHHYHITVNLQAIGREDCRFLWASIEYLWNHLAVHMIQLHFILTKLSHDWLFEQSAAHERGGQFW